MYILKDQELVDFVGRKLKGITKERYAKKQLEEYCLNNRNRICCISGLRRTGKTTLMCQQMLELLKNASDQVVFIECAIQDTMQDLYKVVKDMPYDNIFIDEVTKLVDFVGIASVLSDILVPMGHNIILSGTDSLAFAAAEANELFDRALFIKTTYIPYLNVEEFLSDIVRCVERIKGR